jgi:hypothetical protein
MPVIPVIRRIDGLNMWCGLKLVWFAGARISKDLTTWANLKFSAA